MGKITYIVFGGRAKLHIYRLSGADQITYLVVRGRAKLHMKCGARYFKKYLKNILKNKAATLNNKAAT